jgi:hypothetical protein
MQPLLHWLYETTIATAIREDGNLFPWIESVHVLAITLVVGSISIVDLRLIGLVWKGRAVSRLLSEVLPVTWVAFVLAAVTGALLFSSNAEKYTSNHFFQAKMILLVVAFVNMIAFHIVTARGMEAWDTSPKVPVGVRAAGGISLGLWIAIIACGRWIGFTMNAF